MSQLMFWNKQNNNSNNNSSNTSNGSNNSSNNNGANNSSSNTNGSSSGETKNGKRNWLHAPDALLNGHIAYLVKFFGHLPVEQPKGIEVVKDAILKLQFAQHMKKAETGTQEKFKKVEITISVDGVAVQEPRTQKILHQFPLHNISYCADEKGVKKFFSFIAKTPKGSDGGGSISSNGTGSTGGSNAEETHECFVFISNKLASDITLTIGQAFELAYRKYINSNEKTDLGKAQQQIADLEKTVAIYKNRLREVSLKVPRAELEAMLFKMGVKDVLDVPPSSEAAALANGKLLGEEKLLIDTNSSCHSTKSGSSAYAPIVPPRNNIQSQIMHKASGQKMEELLLNSDSDSDFDPRAEEFLDRDSGSGSGGGGGGSGSGGRNDSNDLFGFEPSKSYGQQLFYNNNNEKLLNNNIGGNNFTNEMNLTPPLLAPPPKVAAPRRNTSMNNNNNGSPNGNTDLFGSDPFEMNGPGVFTSKLSAVSVDDFSLESLDPLRK